MSADISMSTRPCWKDRQVFLAHTEDKLGAQQQREVFSIEAEAELMFISR